MATVRINRRTDIVTRQVALQGLTEIMFDRYPGDNKTQLEPHQKLYHEPGDSMRIGIPATNITSFLSSHNTNSAPKRLRDARKYKKICDACLSFVTISPAFLLLKSDGVPIEFEGFVEDRCPKSGIYVHKSVARLEKGIPNPKLRPVVPLPWGVEFQFTLVPNSEVNEQEIVNLIEEGGLAIGLGTFRGVFGKFRIHSWE